jgi:hypothetical protein
MHVEKDSSMIYYSYQAWRWCKRHEIVVLWS